MSEMLQSPFPVPSLTFLAAFSQYGVFPGDRSRPDESGGG